MWETIKCWLRGLWRELKPSLQALCLYILEIAVGVIAYAVFRTGAALIRYISDLWKNPGASEFFKFVEWLITITGVFAAAVVVVFCTVRFLNRLLTIFFGINFIEIIKRRLGLSGSDDQAQPPGPPPPPTSEQSQEQTEEQSGHGEEGQFGDAPEDQAKRYMKNQSKKKAKSKSKNKSNKSSRKGD